MSEPPQTLTIWGILCPRVDDYRHWSGECAGLQVSIIEQEGGGYRGRAAVSLDVFMGTGTHRTPERAARELESLLRRVHEALDQ